MQMKFWSEDYFSGLMFFNDPEISDSGLLCLENNHRLQPGLNSQSLSLEESMLPQYYRYRQRLHLNKWMNEWMNLAKHPWKGKASCF